MFILNSFTESYFKYFQVVLVIKNLPANAGDTGSIPRSGISPGGGNGNLLQYSYLENPMDRGAWWTTVHRVKKNWTQLKQLSVQYKFKESSSWQCKV